MLSWLHITVLVCTAVLVLTSTNSSVVISLRAASRHVLCNLEQEGRVRLNVIDWRSATLSKIKFGSKSMVSVEDDGWQQVVLLTLVTDCKASMTLVIRMANMLERRGIFSMLCSLDSSLPRGVKLSSRAKRD